MRIPTHIMIHHSLTPDGGTVSWAAIEKFHKETNKWLDIGYHAGVELITSNPDLNKYKYQALIGRPLHALAAACPQQNMNNIALHVCCVGNFDLAPPSVSMINVLLNRVILPWAEQFSIPTKNWIGHKDANPNKTCPGTMFDLNILRVMGTA